MCSELPPTDTFKMNPCHVEYYDMGFYFAYPGQPEHWTDQSQADDYIKDIATECERDLSCYTDGCRWSIVYSLCGITLILIAVNSGIQLVGVWSYHSRALGACCGSCLCCLTMAAIITAGVFRFNTMGSLAALSKTPSSYDGDDFMVYNVTHDEITVTMVTPPVDVGGRTYADDGKAILWIWITMIVFCCINCCTCGYVTKPPIIEPDSH